MVDNVKEIGVYEFGIQRRNQHRKYSHLHTDMELDKIMSLEYGILDLCIRYVE
jgi:hypothetical protein